MDGVDGSHHRPISAWQSSSEFRHSALELVTPSLPQLLLQYFVDFPQTRVYKANHASATSSLYLATFVFRFLQASAVVTRPQPPFSRPRKTSIVHRQDNDYSEFRFRLEGRDDMSFWPTVGRYGRRCWRRLGTESQFRAILECSGRVSHLAARVRPPLAMDDFHDRFLTGQRHSS
jgi:hypothetical protein